MLKPNKKELLIVGFLCFVVSLMYIALFSFSTSPLYFYSGNDSSVYILLGKFLKDGLVMYEDFFEHKGPVIFFIEYIGSVICEGRLGAFVIQVVFMTLTIWGLYKLSNLYDLNKKTIIVIVLSLLALNTYYEGGNLTEEFCLPVIMISVYFLVKYLKSYKAIKYNYKYAIIYGVSFTYCAFIRLTNALPICVFVLCTVLLLIINKKWKELFKSGCAFLLGATIVTAPIIAYCAYNRILEQMIYDTFLYNFMYVTKKASGDSITIKEWLYLIPLLFLFVCGLVYFVKNISRYVALGLMLSGTISVFLQLHGRFYLHYLMMWIPVFCVAISVAISDFNSIKIKKTGICVFCGLLIVTSWLLIKNARIVTGDIPKQYNNDYLKNFQTEARLICKRIGKEDRNSVLAYNADIYFYMAVDIDPCYKIYANQDWLGKSDESIRDAFVKYLDSGDAKYIVAGKKVKELATLERNYKMIEESKHLRLYLRNKAEADSCEEKIN